MTKKEFFDKWGCLTLSNYKLVEEDFDKVMAYEYDKGLQDGLESAVCIKTLEVG